MTPVIVISLLALAFFLRILPKLIFRQTFGIDHYFWMQYVAAVRKDRKFPPTLPQYVLDVHQWYPPVFPLLLCVVPDRWLQRFNYFVAIGLDLLRMSLLFTFIGNNPQALVVGGLIYATTPLLVSYNVQLNPRGIGAILLEVVILLMVAGSHHPAAWVAIAILSGLILLTHKMTTQLFWFLSLVAAIAVDWKCLFLIPVSILAAILLSGGFYVKVMRAHWDIVKFWNHNWKWLQCHPIKDSAVYGDPHYEHPKKFYKRGVPGLIQHARYFVAYCPALWIGVIGIAAGFYVIPGTYLLVWAGGILLFALLTVFVPFMKCLGSGFLYLYNAALPVALFWGTRFERTPESWTLLSIALALNGIALFFYFKGLFANRIQKTDSDFEKLLGDLTSRPKGLVTCFPQQWYDLIAFKTGQPVLYGGHGYGFKLLQPIFPRLEITITEMIARYDLKYIVVLRDFCTPRILDELAPLSKKDFGPYTLYSK